jgi:hypothetical protein
MFGINPVVLRAVLGGGGLLLSVLTLRSGGQTGAATRESDKASTPQEVATPVQTSPLANSTLKQYSDGINPGLFGEGAPVKAKAISAPVMKAMPVAPAVAVQPLQDPLAGYVYTGFVHSNGQPVALIENKKTREGFYLQVGDAFGDGIVNKIESGSVEIKPSLAGQTPRLLPMNTRYSLTPLDKGEIGGEELRQVEAFDGAVQKLSVTYNGLNYNRWINGYDTLLRSGISEEEAQHLQNEVFEGRLTAEEATQRGLGNGFTGDVLRLNIMSNWSVDTGALTDIH